MYDKKLDLAGLGISTYEEVSKILPENYKAVLPPLKRMEALYMIKEYVEKVLGFFTPSIIDNTSTPI